MFRLVSIHSHQFICISMTHSCGLLCNDNSRKISEPPSTLPTTSHPRKRPKSGKRTSGARKPKEIVWRCCGDLLYAVGWVAFNILPLARRIGRKGQFSFRRGAFHHRDQDLCIYSYDQKSETQYRNPLNIILVERINIWFRKRVCLALPLLYRASAIRHSLVAVVGLSRWESGILSSQKYSSLCQFLTHN